MRGVQHPVRFIVVSDGPSLLWYDTSERVDLVRRVYNVAMKECVLSENQNILNCFPFQCNIKLKVNSEPVIHAARRIPAILRDKLKVELERMEKLGIIHRVDYPTEWVNSMVITQKPNGDFFKDLNRNILREHSQLPKNEEIFEEMSGAKWFSNTDPLDGWHYNS